MLKAAFLRWKSKNYPEIKFDAGQSEYVIAYFNNVQSGASEPLPEVAGKSVVQMLIAGFWEDCRDGIYKQTGPLSE